MLQRAGRLDRVLKDSFGAGSAWLTGKAWDYLFEHRKVTGKNGKVLKPGDAMKEGDVVVTEFPSTELGLLAAPVTDITKLIYLDPEKRFFVWNKSAGTPTLPQLPWENHTAVNEAFLWAKEAGLEEGFLGASSEISLEAGLVQRLDTDTSGILLFALKKEVKALFRKWISEHLLEKTYLVLVRGEWTNTNKEHSFLLSLSNPKQVQVVKRVEGDRAVDKVSLNIHCLQKNLKASLLEVKTCFGSRHIVRASLASLGHPLLGDKLYGVVEANDPAHHQLHASGLRLCKKASSFSALEVGLSVAAPEGFKQVLKEFGLAND